MSFGKLIPEFCKKYNFISVNSFLILYEDFGKSKLDYSQIICEILTHGYLTSKYILRDLKIMIKRCKSNITLMLILTSILTISEAKINEFPEEDSIPSYMTLREEDILEYSRIKEKLEKKHRISFGINFDDTFGNWGIMTPIEKDCHINAIGNIMKQTYNKKAINGFKSCDCKGKRLALILKRLLSVIYNENS